MNDMVIIVCLFSILVFTEAKSNPHPILQTSLFTY